MSNRSLYPEGVEVHQRHLENSESQRTASDKRILSDASTRGVMSGLGVIVSATNTRIDIASGSAYAPNGEFMTLTAGQVGVALADYTLNVKNYVLLVYDEAYSLPESHESDGTTRNTKATVAPRLTVITESAYNALSNDNAVLTANDKNRSVILAKVTANGPAVPLTSGSIQLPSLFPNALAVTQPQLINGVTVVSVDATTTTGVGQLNFLVAPTRLTWAAPGDVAGATTTLTGTGSYVVTSANGKTILVLVTFSNLPSIATGPDSITITAIYAQEVARHSAQDFQHRSMIGSGAPTTRNPHGMTIDDLASGVQGTLQEHQDVQHSNGIARFSAANTLKVTVDLNGASPDTLRIGAFSAGDYCYVNGNKINVLSPGNDLSLSGNDAKLQFTNPADTAVSTWCVYLNQDAIVTKTKRAELVPVLGDLTDKLQIVNVSEGITTGSCTITWNNPGGGSTIDAGGYSKPAPVANTVLRLYLANDVDYIDVFAKGASTPVATQTATCTFSAGLNLEENLQIGYAYYTGFASGHLGFGFGLDNSPNTIFDKRTYGNLGKAEMADDAEYTEPASIMKGIFEDGIVLNFSDYGDGAPNFLDITGDRRTRQNAFDEDFNWPVGTTVAASLNMNGGTAYVGGRKFNIVGTVAGAMTAGVVNRVYINYLGVVQISAATWEIIVGDAFGKPICPLWEVTLNGGGAETARTDLRNVISHRHNVENGTVGLNNFRQAAWGTTSNATSSAVLTLAHNGTSGGAIAALGAGTAPTIAAQSLGSGRGVSAVGGLTGGDAIVGTGFATGTRGGLFVGGATSGPGVVTTGTGSGGGIVSTGGNTTGSVAGTFNGGSTNGDGVLSQATGSGTGITSIGGTTDNSVGGVFSSFATNGRGSRSVGTGTGTGAEAVGGGTNGSFAAVLTSAATNGNALSATATGTGNAAQFSGGSANVVTTTAASAANGIAISSASGHCITAVSSSSGDALRSTGGGVTIPNTNRYKYSTVRTQTLHIPSNECRAPWGTNSANSEYGIDQAFIFDGPVIEGAVAAGVPAGSAHSHLRHSILIHCPISRITKLWCTPRLPFGATITDVKFNIANWDLVNNRPASFSASTLTSDGVTVLPAITTIANAVGVTLLAGTPGNGGGGAWYNPAITPTVVPSDGWVHFELELDLRTDFGAANRPVEFFNFRVTYTYDTEGPII